MRLLRHHVLPEFEGSADLLVVWEEGEWMEGIRLRDGRVTVHRVVATLEDGEVDAPILEGGG